MNNFIFFKFPASLEAREYDLKNKEASYWEKLGESKLVELVNFTIQNVPAYKQYLHAHGVKVTHIDNIADFKSLPLMDKHSYLKSYRYSDLFPPGYIDNITTISSTSGSTGEPFYFPRGEDQDRQYEYIAELYLRNQFEINKKRTLAINGFGLGIWIGGMFTYKNFNKIASKGYRLALAPVGTDKAIFLKTFKKMAGLFDQIILMGYPPFIKDVIDEAKDYGIIWKDYDIKVMNATEGYSEKFREYLIKKLHLKDRYSHVLNIYGSVELGTMSHETPIANLIRKLAVDNKKLFKLIFPEATEIPTLAQFHPYVDYFEDVDGEVVASGFGSSFPLLRYRFYDRGGVISFDTMINNLRDVGIDIIKEAKNVGISDSIMKLPFVYVYSRSDFVVILRGANIYPENIRTALQASRLERYLTGKFCMLKKENVNMEEYLEVNVELKKGVKCSEKVEKLVTKEVLNSLREKNSEFNYLYTNEGKKLIPTIILHSYEDPQYFAQGIKQKWVIK